MRAFEDRRRPGGSAVEVTRSEEQLEIEFDRVPVARVRIVRYLVTEEVTRTFQIRREELRVEQVPAEDQEPLDRWAARPDRDSPVEVVLHDERVEITTRVVPRERVRLWVEDVPAGERTVTAQLATEHVEVDETIADQQR